MRTNDLLDDKIRLAAMDRLVAVYEAQGALPADARLTAFEIVRRLPLFQLNDLLANPYMEEPHADQ